jgi:hypothetical protein
VARELVDGHEAVREALRPNQARWRRRRAWFDGAGGHLGPVRVEARTAAEDPGVHGYAAAEDPGVHGYAAAGNPGVHGYAAVGNPGVHGYAAVGDRGVHGYAAVGGHHEPGLDLLEVHPSVLRSPGEPVGEDPGNVDLTGETLTSTSSARVTASTRAALGWVQVLWESCDLTAGELPD